MIKRNYPQPRQWEALSVIPLLAGLYWLLADIGLAWWLWALLPGGLLLTSGVALLLIPGDPRISAMMALGAVLGVLFTVPAWIVADFGTAFIGLLGAVVSFQVAGRVGLMREPLYEGAEAPELCSRLDFKAGLDEALLGYFVLSANVPSGAKAEHMCDEALRLEAAFAERGWLDDPAPLHPAPPPPEDIRVEQRSFQGHPFELLRYDSGFAPDANLPGATLWRSYAQNHRCAVRVLRHAGEPRPWLLCIHGYRMGTPLLDFSLFSPNWLHHKLGLNVVQPVLPLHGPRKIGLRTGDHYLDGDLLDLVYAESQALWDLRRTLAWIRTQDEEARIGVLGYSLGGYNAALLANYESGLDFVIAGIPVTDFASALWRFMPPAHLRYVAARGLDEERYRRILSVVSPLAGTPRVERERLQILAAAADRVVLPSHPLLLSRHWDVPVSWYQGSHLSVRNEPETREALNEALLRAGWPPR